MSKHTSKLEEMIKLYDRHVDHAEYHFNCDKSDGHLEYDKSKLVADLLAWHREEVERIIGEYEEVTLTEWEKRVPEPVPIATEVAARNQLKGEQRLRASLEVEDE